MEHLKQVLINELHIPGDLCNRFVELSERRTVKKKELFAEQGKVCTSIGFVESGVLRSYIEKDATEYIKEFYFPKTFVVAYGSFLTGESCIGSIQALSETHLITISRAVYDLLLSESNEWLKLGKYISDSLLIKKCRKETSFLMDSAYERYKLLLKTYPAIEQQVSQHHIAAYLGIHPESLSRLKTLNIGQ